MKTKKASIKSQGANKTIFQWDKSSTLERLIFVIKYLDIFYLMRLITKSEIEAVLYIHDSAKEYIVLRENQPFFSSLHLKKDIKDQNHQKKLEITLHLIAEKENQYH